MKKISSIQLDEAVESYINQYGIHQYGENIFQAIRHATIQELKNKGIEVEFLREGYNGF